MLHIPEASSTRMPGYPAEACETSYCRSTDEPNYEDGFEHLSAEERVTAKKNLSLFCQPVEFYNYLQHRATKHPSFLRRCLDYRIKAKLKKRIHLTVSLSWKDDEPPCVFPLRICLAKLDPNDDDEETTKYSAVYKTNQIFTFRGSSEVDGYGNTQVQASFMLPELDKLDVEAKSGKLVILVFTSVGNPISSSGVNANMVPLDVASEESRAGENCLLGKVCLESVYCLWLCDPKFSLGQRTEYLTAIELRPCILKYGIRKKGKSISIQDPLNSDKGMSKLLLASISAEEFGAKDIPPYHIHASSEVASTSLSHIIRLKEGNVTFNYRSYNNNLQMTEVTEDFFCPFCLIGCASYKGLRCHLLSFHDLFDFEFLASEGCPYVNVYVKIDTWDQQIVADGVYPREQTFIFCAKPLKRREARSALFENAQDTDQMLLDPELPEGDIELLDKDDGSNAIILHPGLDCVPLISEHDDGTPMVVDMEGFSNAINLHLDTDCAPPISEHDHGTPMVVDMEGTSNAINLHLDPDCAPPISEHDHGTPMVVDMEGTSNAINLHQDPDCAPPMSELDNGAPAVLQIDKGKLPISEHDHGAPLVLQIEKGKLPISEHDHGAPLVLQIDKGKLPISEHDHGAPVVLHIDKGKLPISEHHHGTPAVLQIDKGKLPISEHDHGTPAVRRRFDKKGKLPISEHDHGTPAVRRRFDKKGKLPISEHDHGAPMVLQIDKGKLPISEHDHGTPAVRRRFDKKGKLPISEHDHRTPAVRRRYAKKGKLPIKDLGQRIIAQLEKRQFYHSHKYQPMVLEEALLDQGSEDEMDEEVIEIEERRMLEDLDVSDDLRRFMFMWNSFVRRHGVRADGHINWAYEAFTTFYRAVLAESPALACQWRFFMIKLWNHGLLDARTIDRCSVILQQYQRQNSDPKS